MIFHFNDNELRHVMIEGEPWFVAQDVCRCLGLRITSGTTEHTSRLAAGEKRTMRPSQAGLMGLTRERWLEAFGLAGLLSFVNESGLYKLIMRSDKPEARKFQDWVTREVLPAIRKTGGYLLNEGMRETAVADAREEFPSGSIGQHEAVIGRPWVEVAPMNYGIMVGPEVVPLHVGHDLLAA